MKNAGRNLRLAKASALILAGAFIAVFAATLSVRGASGRAAFRPEERFEGCTNILVGREATADGSTIGTYSCDGPPYGAVQALPGERFPGGALTTIYENKEPRSLEEYLASTGRFKAMGTIPQELETYPYINQECGFDHEPCGGANRYGVTTGESTIGGRRELRNSKGMIWVYSNSKNNSLLALALQRAKTAREAIRVMGSLAEKYGYAQTGEHVTVTDGREVWAFEIFGPGADWIPGSGRPGAVWCAERIPDGHVGVCANRSRIGEINLKNSDFFLASPNVYTLATEKGWWDPKSGRPFIWSEAYAKSESPQRGSLIREWRILSLVAPSLKLSLDGANLPFSVKPDKPLSVQDVIALHRDVLKGTPYDPTEKPAFYLGTGESRQKSPMACPFGPPALHRLLGVSSERLVGTDTSCFVSIAQVRSGLPDPVKACVWFTLGPAWSGCFVPIYSGCSELAKSWAGNNPARIVRGEAMWALKLTHELSYINYQNAARDIEGVRDAAEARFFARQKDFETSAIGFLRSRGEAAARQLATRYTCEAMDAVAEGYWNLVDYLLFTYYFRSSSRAPQKPPAIPPVKINS